MQRLKYLLTIVFALMISGCGQSVVETLNVPQAPGVDSPGYGKTIVVLPFADYTYSDDFASAYRRNLKVSESLTDNLSAQGFGMPVSEDVFSYLISQNIIKVDDYQNNSNVSLTNELSGSWSQVMKQEIRNELQHQRVTHRKPVEDAPGTHALNTKSITKMGRTFQADYIVRGRILEFKTRQEATWAPWKKGVFPVISGATAQFLYGFAGSESYDTINQIIAGGIWGATAGSISDWPIDDANIELFGDGGATGNEIFWSAAGGYLGKQASESGRVDQAVVQLRMWVQDATTGQVVWTNRAMVRVSPESIFSDGQYDDLFNTAIEKGVSTLVENFVTVGL